jgi:FKBP-type peptidyl-prolyl cis-trans isomerase SlyD
MRTEKVALRIEPNRVVTLTYRITDSEGHLLEEKTPEDPYEYVHGSGQILPAIERMITGKTSGFSLEVQLSPAEAYGAYDPSLVAEMPLKSFPPGIDVEPGMKFSTLGPDGREAIVRVLEVEGPTVTIDGNHPLAGVDVIFELRVLDVRDGEPGSELEDLADNVVRDQSDEFASDDTEILQSDLSKKRTLH